MSQMFRKKTKKPEISKPQNFEHRVHTGFDREQGTYVGLPPQWQGIIGPSERRRPIVDPAHITPTDVGIYKVTISNFLKIPEYILNNYHIKLLLFKKKKYQLILVYPVIVF